jgi:hypothetical protein
MQNIEFEFDDFEEEVFSFLANFESGNSLIQ